MPGTSDNKLMTGTSENKLMPGTSDNKLMPGTSDNSALHEQQAYARVSDIEHCGRRARACWTKVTETQHA